MDLSVPGHGLILGHLEYIRNLCPGGDVHDTRVHIGVSMDVRGTPDNGVLEQRPLSGAACQPRCGS